MEQLQKMKLGIFGAVALVLGIWAMTEWWWFVVEVFQGLLAFALVVGGVLTLAIAARRMLREKASAE
jgi:hypothetical protein